MGIKIIDNLSRIWSEDKNKNDYTCFNDVKNTYGVYIFRNKKNEKILYVGEARKQFLKDRIIQNFTKNSGGTFRKNFLEKNKDKIELFKEIIIESHIIIITCKKNIIIRALESILINVLNPKYNKDT